MTASLGAKAVPVAWQFKFQRMQGLEPNLDPTPAISAYEYEEVNVRKCSSSLEGSQSEIDQTKIQRGRRKIRTGSDSDQPKSATDEELQPKRFNPNLLKGILWLVAIAPSSDFVRP